MIFLKPEQYPQDFFYHRTASEIYRTYLEGCGPQTFEIGNPPQYAWKKPFFHGNLGVVRYERTDVEPDIEKLKAEQGIKHGMVTWIPYSRTEVPKGWRRLYLTDHFRETGYVILDENAENSQKQEIRGGEDFSKGVYSDVNVPQGDFQGSKASKGQRGKSDSNDEVRRLGEFSYRKKWNERSRRAIKKFEKSGAIIRAVDGDTFAKAFRETKVKHWYKSDYIRYYKKMVAIDPEKVRQWLVYVDGKPVAGLAVHDYISNHSVHLVAFTGKEAYPSQGGTALIDEWFRNSLEKGIKYLSFDQLRQRGGPSEQKGYTEFKENFIEYRLSFPRAWFKMF